MSALRLGAIADDFTGATDLAVTLQKEGMRVAQLFGVPEAGTRIGEAEAVVIALKSRTAPADEAVAQSRAACDWLTGRGASQIFFKYCSTFDSTPEGNIGPVADALLSQLQADLAFVCPAFPANARSVYMGHLFVGQQLLSDSPMKDHPLTPMRDSDLVRVMAAQSTHTVGLICHDDVASGRTRQKAQDLLAAGHRYAVVDAIAETDLRAIGAAAKDHPLITGGSGVAMGLPANFGITTATALLPVAAHGRSLILAGSCSEMTRRQIAEVAEDWPSWKLDVAALIAGEITAAELFDWVAAQPADAPVLVYASDSPAEVSAGQARFGRAKVGDAIEECLASLAVLARESGFGTMVVAGGETSGAVVSALGLRALRIGPEVAPGVPWTETLEDPPLSLALKSGNFGGPGFFRDAMGVLA